MKTTVSIVLAGILVAGIATGGEHPGHDAKAETKITPQTTCPVMGGKINKQQYADHDGKRIYVCCAGCIGKIKADPEKYVKKLEGQGVTVAKLQTTCPVMGGKINKQLYVDHDGKRIYVCCAGCIGKIKADPAKYIGDLEQKGVVLDAAAGSPIHKKERGGHKGHNH